MSAVIQFVSESGTPTGNQLDVPLEMTPSQLIALLNDLLENAEKMPYSFLVNDTVLGPNQTLGALLQSLSISSESIVSVVYQPQALFRVRPVTRNTASLPGHTEAILIVTFHPCGSVSASGSGDRTIRLWDLDTQTPIKTLTGHNDWILALAYSPDGQLLASGSKDGTLKIWDTAGNPFGKSLMGHKQWITAIAWEPLSLSGGRSRRLATSSKDSMIRIWDSISSACEATLSGHALSVTTCRWSAAGTILSASQDRTIKIWNESNAGWSCVRTLGGHAHWVNSMALSTDFVLRTGCYELDHDVPEDPKARERIAKERVARVLQKGSEMMVTGSDDHTLQLWDLATCKQVGRMVGHQGQVNHVSFSPDGRYIASASFDKSVRLWDGRTGKYLGTFRGHVGPVYMAAFSADSRFVVSVSKDSTMKLWDVGTRKMVGDLPGHADEVFAVDWSPDGARVMTGGKDKIVKIWRH